MSTKSSIKWKQQTETEVGYHLYDDVMDQFTVEKHSGTYGETGV